ncbi:MAG TPA: polysaccharide deacetylase family protein [Vicinamibacteria bacterium]|nr:polysaccharide deacetylase family protein [Vicinamibacteria bacterium]
MPPEPRRVVLSVDLDEWYHCRWATGSPRSRWRDTAQFFREHYRSDRPTGELVEPTHRVLALFDRLGVKGSFFILGEVARFYPDLVREIAARGHEVGCHGFHHVDVDLLGPEGFRRELAESCELLASLVGRPVAGYRAPNLLVRDWMIPMLRAEGLRYDASVCTSRALLGKDFGHEHVAANPYRFSDAFARPDPTGDLVEIPLPTFPVLRLPAATGILTRVVGRAWTLTALRRALRTGDAQYYFHPYELGPRPKISLSLRERLFLRRLGPWMEEAVEAIALRLRSWGARFVTAEELAAAVGTAR